MQTITPPLPCLSVRQERDEVLEMYLDQPFDDYCITRKELLGLLRRHHKTTIELEREKEEKQRFVLETWCVYSISITAPTHVLTHFVLHLCRLQNLLDAKKSLFERYDVTKLHYIFTNTNCMIVIGSIHPPQMPLSQVQAEHEEDAQSLSDRPPVDKLRLLRSCSELHPLRRPAP